MALAESHAQERSNIDVLARQKRRTSTPLAARTGKPPGVRACRKAGSPAAHLVAHKALQPVCHPAFLELRLRLMALCSTPRIVRGIALQLRPERTSNPQHVGKNTSGRHLWASTRAAHDQRVGAIARSLKLHDIVRQGYMRESVGVGQALQ